MLKAFRGQQFEHTHENKIFDDLYDVLANHCAATQQDWALFGNFHVGNRELDALVVKPNALIVIDFKNFTGKLDISEDGPWFVEDSTNGQRVQVKGGASLNPLVQLRYNKRALAEFMENVSQQCNWGHIAAMVLFHGAVEFDNQEIPGKCKPWFHIADMSNVVRALEAIVSREISVAPNAIRYIVNRLGLPPFVPANSLNTRLLAGSEAASDDKEPTSLQQQALAEFSGWIRNPSGVFRLLGMAATGKRFLFPFFISLIEQTGLRPLLLAPSARFAGSYRNRDIRGASIYGWLYSTRPTRFEDNKGRKIALHDICENIDLKQVMPILVEAHLLSDENLKFSDRRYGSGRLITDFLAVVDDTPFFVIGDSYQLSRGSPGRSITALTPPSYLDGKVRTCELAEQILSPTDKAVNILQAHLRDSIVGKRFNLLPKFTGDRLSIVEKPFGRQWQPDTDNAMPESVYLCAKHDQVNQANASVKINFLHHDDPVRLAEGDRIDFYARTPVLSDGDAYNADFDTQWISSGAFGVVDKIIESIEIEEIHLSGRPQPTVVRLQKIACRVFGLGEIKIKYLPDFYEAETPGLAEDYEIALRALAYKRAKPLLERYKANILKDKNNPEYAEAKKKYDLLEYDVLQSQGIITAARIRPAFAMTVHRAQGRYWPEVWLNASPMPGGHSYTNSGYFRWLYTATTCATDRMLVQNFPEISPMMNAVIKRADDANIVGPISIKTGFQYDKTRVFSEGEAEQFQRPDGFSETKLLPLLLELNDRLQHSPWRLTKWQEHSYLLSLTLASEVSGSLAKVQLYYNSALSVTKIIYPDDSHADYETISGVLNKPFKPESQALAEALSCLMERTAPCGFQLCGAKESAYRIRGVLAKGEDAVEFELNANKEGLVSSVHLLKATTEAVLSEVKLALRSEK